MYTDAQKAQYQKNMKMLRQYNPSVYMAAAAKGNLFDDVAEWLPEEDNFTIRSRTAAVFVHSRYDRERELEKLVEGIAPSDTTVILFGLGNGRVLERIQAQSPQLMHLIIVEPNALFVEHFFHTYDFMEIGRQFGQVSLVINQPAADAAAMIRRVMLAAMAVEQRTAVIAGIAYRTLYRDYYQTLIRAATEAIRLSRVNNVTTESWRRHWLVNFWRNLPYLSLELGYFTEMFRGKPAIMVSAGPSLDKNIHLLKDVGNKACIIAVGSAISILAKHGITPHFRAALDPSQFNESIFADIDTVTCPLIYTDHLYFGILPRYQGTKIHMTVADEQSLIQHIMQEIGMESFSVASGFSVANTTLNFLCKLGCSSTIFMGQDLCYTEGRLHAAGSWDEAMNRPAKGHIAVEDIFGNTVYTDSPFAGMKRMLESTIAQYPSLRFINATEGGLALTGVPNQPFNEVLTQELIEEYDYRQAIDDIILDQQASAAETQEKIRQVVDELADSLSQAVTINADIISKLYAAHNKVKNTLHRDSAEKEIKRLHTRFAKLQKNEVYARFVLPVFQDSFLLRRKAVEIDKENWRGRWTSELEIMLLEADETQGYMLLMQELIREYKGETKLNIIFE